jgi:hypothetical protein
MAFEGSSALLTLHPEAGSEIDAMFGDGFMILSCLS